MGFYSSLNVTVDVLPITGFNDNSGTASAIFPDFDNFASPPISDIAS
jgi:hypothetical protein